MQSTRKPSERLMVFPQRPLLLSAVISLFLFSAPDAYAAPPELSLPIDCTIGKTCWLVNFVDHDPGPKHQDFRCGTLSYNTHKGTDIAIANNAEMLAGVAVLAAAPGRVLGIRDGEPRTRQLDPKTIASLKGRECGNGVLIDHGDDWTTQYCHMKGGSLRVAVGDMVQRGDVLGQVGLSGRTEFPHIHLSVRQGKTVIDPFSASSNIAACQTTAGTQSMWSQALQKDLTYPGPQPYHLGFAPQVPDFKDIRAGKFKVREFDASVPALVFWAEAFSLNKGDHISMMLRGPGGNVIAKDDIVLDRPKARMSRFTGSRKRGSSWETGTYQAQLTIKRGTDTVTQTATATIK